MVALGEPGQARPGLIRFRACLPLETRVSAVGEPMPPEPRRPTGQHTPGAGPAPLPARRPGASDLTVFTTRPPGQRRDAPVQPWRWLPAEATTGARPAGLRPAAGACAGPFLSPG